MSVLRSSQKLICSSLAIVALRTSQIVDELAATPRALMPLLELFLDHVLSLGLRPGSSSLATHRNTASNLTPARVLPLRPLTQTLLLTSIVNLLKVFLVGEGVGPELLGLLAGALLVGTHLLLAHREVFLGVRTLINIHIHWMTALLGSHDEARWGLAGVIDDDIVDVIVVYDVRNVLLTSVARLRLRARLLIRGWATASHTEPLTVRIPCSLEISVVFALLSH